MTTTSGFLKLNAPWLSAGALLTLLSSFGQTFFISLFAADIRLSFDLSHGEWGGLYSLGTTASAIIMIWAGSLVDHFRVRSLGACVLAALSLACVMMALNPYVWALPIVIFALRFTGQGMLSHIAVVAMARWFVATRGRALSIAGLGFKFGEAVLPIAFVALLAIVDWRVLWGVAAAISLAGIPVLLMLLTKERTPQSMAQESPKLGMGGLNWTRKDTLVHPLFWLMIPALLGPSAFNTAFFFLQVHFAEIKGLSHLSLVKLFPIYTIVSIIAMGASGWGLDKWGTARLMPFFQIPMVAAFLCFAFSQSLMLLMLGFVFLALTAGAGATLPAAFWAEFYGTKYIGSIKALAAAVIVLGSAIGPGITGILIDLGIGLETQFIAIAVYFVAASILIWIGIKRYSPALT